ncbi:penicillin-binding protein [Calidifontibacillus oryziterrae]|uniref:penicillin-binding protein n=1 Tax=Calidifontibacillus oryziterrae TaxID=1191699 RepID=UPI0002FDD986|nr:penicillin-binding protein [Calidifontibacillus oryziterrae]
MNKARTVHIKVGARILSIVFVLLFFILACRFVYIQVTKSVEGQVLTTLAEDKWEKERVIEASRGQILDRNSEIIAKDVPTYSMYAIIKKSYSKNSPKPLHVDDPHDAAVKLAPLIGMEVSEIERRLTPKSEDDFQVEFGPNGRNIDHLLMEKIAALKIPGINFRREKKRLYPNGVFASHVIGFALPDDEGKLVGNMGVEKTFDSILQGQDGFVSFQSDRKGFKLPDPKEMVTSPINGKDVYLTIDQKIQTFLETALSDAFNQYEPENMIGIVADAKTGEILAMATRPSFDPNTRKITNYLNDAISSRYEPGSTMKVFTLAAAIDAGVFNGHEEYQSGSYRISEKDKPIRDHNKSGWGKITYLEGVQRSSNVAFAKLVNEKLGTDKFLDYLQRFGFDKPTGIDLPNEVAGNILYRYPIEKITTAFGQGTSITPIQQIQAATAISNGGKMMKPFIIKKIVDPKTGEVIKEQQPTVVNEPIKAETAQEVLNILETVVSSDAGTGKAYRIDGYEIAGKTGTAQIADPKTEQYMTGHGNNIFSFLGFVPKDDPQLIMYVSVKQPKIKITELGSEPISYVFKTVIKNSLHYLNIVPLEEKSKSKPIAENGIEVPNIIGKSLDSVKTELINIGTHPVSIGSSIKVIEQLPVPNTRVLPGELVVLKTEGKIVMPDMTGWSLRDILKITELMSLKPNIIGSGYVSNQNIKPGTEVKEGDYLVVELKPPYQEEEQIDEQNEVFNFTTKEDQEIFELMKNVQD